MRSLVYLTALCPLVAGAALKGIPAVAYDSDNGFGYGARISLYADSGSAAAWQVHGEYYATTGGVLQPMVEGDATFRNGIRVRGKAMYDRTLYTGYYGYGNSDAETGYDEDSAADYYYAYRRTNPYAYLTVSVPVDAVPGLAWFSGGGAAWYGIGRSPRVPADGSVPRLFADAPEGVDGGTLVRALAGITYDTRDYEYTARRGTYAECTLEAGRLDRTYSRVTVVAAAYAAPAARLPRLVFAARVLYDRLDGSPPFFVQEKTGGLRPEDGIGGNGTLRGIPRYRYKGNVKLVVTPELRCRIATLAAGKERFHLENVVFADLGNVWMTVREMALPLHVTYGIGPKLLWGEDFIVSACFGFWRNRLGGVYVNTGHQF